MISANDANTKTTNWLSGNLAEELNTCERSVTYAVLNGKYTCDVYRTLSDVCKSELRKLGYTLIEKETNDKSGYVTISWSK